MVWMSEWNYWVVTHQATNAVQGVMARALNESWHMRWMSHGTRVEWVMAICMSHDAQCHMMTHQVICMSHGTQSNKCHINESWHTHEWVMAHTVTYMGRIKETWCTISMSHGTQSNKCHVNESWHTKQQMPYQWVMAHKATNAQRIHASIHRYASVVTHAVTYMGHTKESRHTVSMNHEWVMTHNVTSMCWYIECPPRSSKPIHLAIQSRYM